MDQLVNLVALHETFFAALAQQHPHNYALREFILKGWDPFIEEWYRAVGKDPAVYERRLMTLRANAQALDIPVPDLPSGAGAAVGRAFEGRVVTGPDGRPESAVNAETDRRFSELSGRPVGQALDPRNPNDAAAIAQWNSIHNAVIAEHHLTAELGGKPADQAVAEIDQETNELFWSATNHHFGQPLNPHDPADKPFIPQWLSIRYAVAQAYARDHAGGAAQVAVSGGGHGGGHAGPRSAWGPRRVWGGGGWGWGGPSYYGGYPVVEQIIIDDSSALPPGLPDGYNAGEASMTPDSIVSGQRGVYCHRTGLVAALAPVLAPGTGRVDTKLRLDRNNVLHASVSTDGRSYETSLDLSGAVASLIAELQQAHHDWHHRVQPLIGAAVQQTGNTMIGALIDQHVGVACAGWWHNLEHAASGALHGAENAVKGTIKTLAPVLAPAAQMAAAAIGGAAVGNLASSLVNAAAGNGSAKQVVAAAEAAAVGNPDAAAALATAKSVVAKTTAAYHIASTVQAAAKGNPAAVKQVQDMAASAAQGDPAAQQALAVANTVTDVATQNQQTDGGQQADAVNGWYAIVGAAADDLRKRATLAARAAWSRAGQNGSGAFGYVVDGNGTSLLPFPSADAADDWFGALSPSSIVYAAVFDASDATWPSPVNDKLGEVARVAPPGVPIPRGGAATVSGATAALVGNMAVTEATLERQKQAAIDAYYAAHGAPPDTFAQLVEFVRQQAQAASAHVGGFQAIPWIFPFLTGAFGGIIADQRFGHYLR